MLKGCLKEINFQMRTKLIGIICLFNCKYYIIIELRLNANSDINYKLKHSYLQ